MMVLAVPCPMVWYIFLLITEHTVARHRLMANMLIREDNTGRRSVLGKPRTDAVEPQIGSTAGLVKGLPICTY